jgi:hypothetical protein
MSDNYDSILKEKKVYVEETKEDKYPRLKKFIFLGIIFSIIIIIISYVIYFNTVLASESILLNNLSKIFKQYSLIYKDISLNYNNDDYNVTGTITFDDLKYNYQFLRNSNKSIKVFSNSSNSISYSDDGVNSYVITSKLNNVYIKRERELFTLSDYEDIINLDENNLYDFLYNMLLGDNVFNFDDTIYNLENYSSLVDNIKNNFLSIDSSNYTKKIYVDKGRPIVLINLLLNTKDLNTILNTNKTNLKLSDNYVVSVDMKNDALTNNILLIKVIINNKTTDERVVINYEDNNITITDNDGMKHKFELKKNQNIISLKYYRDDVLYSVLTNEEENNKNIYTYQVINELYSLKLTKEQDNNSYSYTLESNVDNKKNTIIFEGKMNSNENIAMNMENVIDYDDLNEVQKNSYNMSVKDLLFGS